MPKKKQTPEKKKQESRRAMEVRTMSLAQRKDSLRRRIARANKLGNTADAKRMTKELREIVAGSRRKVKEV